MKKTYSDYQCPHCQGIVQQIVKRCPRCKGKLFWSDVTLYWEKAQEAMRTANSAKEWRRAAWLWNKVRAGDYFAFQDKVDYCLSMAQRCSAIEAIFKER